AAMRWWMTFPMTVIDTVFKALAPAIPDQTIAGHHADLCVAKINGFRPSDGGLFLYTGGLIGGGWGAKMSEDGQNATIAINDGDTHNGPSEQVEAKYPLIVEEYALRPDSGGPGRYRGGLGTMQTLRAAGDITVNAQIERVNCRPWGLEGGLEGAGNQVTTQKANGPVNTFPSGKVLAQRLTAGDRVTLMSGGGGGFGSPLDRDLSTVESEVLQGYITREAAMEAYGAVIDAKTLELDVAASEALRSHMRASGAPKNGDGLPHVDGTPGDGTAGSNHRQAMIQAFSSLSPNDSYELKLQLSLARRCC
ncbi:MAG: hydantoinase B/oxoprolinase family protein, partial [Rhodospirillales bacterium]